MTLRTFTTISRLGSPPEFYPPISKHSVHSGYATENASIQRIGNGIKLISVTLALPADCQIAVTAISEMPLWLRNSHRKWPLD